MTSSRNEADGNSASRSPSPLGAADSSAGSEVPVVSGPARYSRLGVLKTAAAGLTGVAVASLAHPQITEAAGQVVASNVVAQGPEPPSHIGLDASKVDTHSAPVFGFGVSGTGRTAGISGSGPNLGVYGAGAYAGVSAYSDAGSALLANSGSGTAVNANSTSGGAISATSNTDSVAAILATNNALGATAIRGVAQGPSGTGIGLDGTGNAYGVYATGGAIGVWGAGPIGVQGTAAGDTGIGLMGQAYYGLKAATVDSGGNPGNGWGVYADGGLGGTGVYSQSSSGTAVQGVSTTATGGDFTGGTVGLSGQSNNGTGVYGYSGHSYGVHGEGEGTGATGVFGKSMDVTGVLGQTFGSGAGVRGENHNNGNGMTGLCFSSNGTDLGTGIGVQGVSGSGVGVFGQSSTGPGVKGSTSAAGQAAVTGANRGSGPAILGSSASGYGGSFQGGTAAVRLVPAAAAGPPSGPHKRGELVVDSQGVLYFCTVSGTPGTWKTVMLA